MADLVPHEDNKNNRSSWGTMPWFSNFYNDGTLDDIWAGAMLPGLNFGRGFRADVRENEKEYIVEAELPGVSRDQIDINLDHNMLTITAKQGNTINEENHEYIRRERRYGEFRRSFSLYNINEDSVTAHYDNGILKVTLPKINGGTRKGRKIDIH